MMDVIPEDPCCGPRMSKAALAGKLDTNTWTCPKCGCEWRATMRDTLRVWEFKPLIEVF